MPDWYQWEANDLILRVCVQPRSREDRIVGLHGNSLKIKITSPPVDGKANEHLCSYLASVIGISKSKVKIESGDSARNKRIRIQLPDQTLPINLNKF